MSPLCPQGGLAHPRAFGDSDLIVIFLDASLRVLCVQHRPFDEVVDALGFQTSIKEFLITQQSQHKAISAHPPHTLDINQHPDLKEGMRQNVVLVDHIVKFGFHLWPQELQCLHFLLVDVLCFRQAGCHLTLYCEGSPAVDAVLPQVAAQVPQTLLLILLLSMIIEDGSRQRRDEGTAADQAQQKAANLQDSFGAIGTVDLIGPQRDLSDCPVQRRSVLKLDGSIQEFDGLFAISFLVPPVLNPSHTCVR
mmetsp:Transcript_310/g.545  ORF Transcript_310/g.545 Transcript_310/m.545 type:complete len:250 (+) Transcript_310:107-856(+)